MPSSAPLTSSRWAPAYLRTRQTLNQSNNNSNLVNTTCTITTPTSTTGVADTEKLTRITRLLARLHWKSELLLLSRNASPPTTSSSAETRETMFRLDFYEFYALLERLLVLLLEACGIVVRSGREEIAREVGEGVGYGRAAHRFHANVLEALEKEGCPLRAALGEGNVRGWLVRAKEFRNRWKDVEEEGVLEGREGLGLEALRVMLSTILEGLEEAQGVVRVRLGEKDDSEVIGGAQVVVMPGGSANGVKVNGKDDQSGTDRIQASDEDSDMGDAPWEAVEDAMDWDWDVS